MSLCLDLELRKDIDDYITLIYALETNKEVQNISIHNPSINELCVLNQTIKEFGKDIEIFYSGVVSTYENGEDIHISLEKHFSFTNKDKEEALNKAKNINTMNTSEFIENFEENIIFCGGSLFTLDKILENVKVSAYIQGGYAGEKVVGVENVLKKFKNRKEVPSWNMNLEETSTDKILNSINLLDAHFISKNVCHDSWISLKDIKNKKSKVYEYLDRYFKDNEYDSKCMHDLVAFMSIFDKSYIEFKKVDILKKTSENSHTKWYSELNENSNKKISTKLDMLKLINVLNKELEEKKQLQKIKTNKKLNRLVR